MLTELLEAREPSQRRRAGNFVAGARSISSGLKLESRRNYFRCALARLAAAKLLAMADIGIHSEEEFRECFSLFDKDKKGAIDEFNFGGCLRSMALNPTEKETKELFAEVAKDVEGVQKADVDAVLAAGRKYAKVMAAADQEQGLRDALKVLDKEGNGMVSSAELRHIVANLKVKTEKIGDEMVHTPIGDEELDEAMEEIDPKKAGQIKIDHLVREVFKKVYIPPLGSVSYLEDRPKRQSLSEMMM